MTTTARKPCPYEFPAGELNDMSTYDRLHHSAASLAHTATGPDRGVTGPGGAIDFTPEELADLLDHAQYVVGLAKDALDLTVETAHARGWSWQQIGDAFGISRQAAHERFAS